MPAYFDDADLAHFGDLKRHAPELWEVFERFVRTGEHCFGCTAGGGSSCGGAIA